MPVLNVYFAPHSVDFHIHEQRIYGMPDVERYISISYDELSALPSLPPKARLDEVQWLAIPEHGVIEKQENVPGVF